MLIILMSGFVESSSADLEVKSCKHLQFNGCKPHDGWPHTQAPDFLKSSPLA